MLDLSIWLFSDLFWIVFSIILGIVTFALPNIKLGAIYKLFPAYASKEVDAVVAKIHAKVYWVSVALLIVMSVYLLTKVIFWVFKVIGGMFNISWLVSLSHNQWVGIGVIVIQLAALLFGIVYISKEPHSKLWALRGRETPHTGLRTWPLSSPQQAGGYSAETFIKKIQEPRKITDHRQCSISGRYH